MRTLFALLILSTVALADESIECTPDGTFCGGGGPGMATTTINEPRTWHLLTQSYGGTVSLIRDLTKHECEYARARALGLPATPEEQAARDEFAQTQAERGKEWCAKSLTERQRSYGGYDIMCSDDGRYSGYMTSGSVSPGDITRAECFE